MAENVDEEFRNVKAWLSDERRLKQIGIAIRQAIDWVIDGARARRYRIEELERTEKAYIGNRVETEILDQWGLEKEPPLDAIICFVPIDVKFSLGRSWMIPPEAINKLCVIITADDNASTCSMGLFRARPEFLGKGKGNRDGKRGIVMAGRRQIDWIALNAELPTNFLLHLPDDIRTRILSQSSGQARLTEMFRRVLEKPIPRIAIEIVARQRDPLKRLRDNGGSRDALRKEGIVIYSWRYDNKKLAKLGWPSLEKDHFMSLQLGESEADIVRLGAEPKV